MDETLSSISSIPDQRWLDRKTSPSDLSSSIFSLPLSRDSEIQEESPPPPPPPRLNYDAIEIQLDQTGLVSTIDSDEPEEKSEYLSEKQPVVISSSTNKLKDQKLNSKWSQKHHFSSNKKGSSCETRSSSNFAVQSRKSSIDRLRHELHQSRRKSFHDQEKADNHTKRVFSSMEQINSIHQNQDSSVKHQPRSSPTKVAAGLTSYCEITSQTCRKRLEDKSIQTILKCSQHNIVKQTKEKGSSTSFIDDTKFLNQSSLNEKVRVDHEVKDHNISTLQEKNLELNIKLEELQTSINAMQKSKNIDERRVATLQLRVIQQQNQIDSLHSENNILNQRKYSSINDSTMQQYSTLTNRIHQLETKFQARENELNIIISETKNNCTNEINNLRRIHKVEIEEKENMLQTCHAKILGLMKKVKLINQMKDNNEAHR